MKLFEEFSSRMPKTEDIALKAVSSLHNKYGGDIKYLRNNFSVLMQEIEKECYRIYLESENEHGEQVILEFLRKNKKESIFRTFDSFYLSISQSRKARAGKTFEAIIKGLFKQLKYPFEEQCVINGKPDFLLPSKAYYQKNAPDCIIFTAKRTLRERWRQIATEGVKGKGLFLATIDEKVTSSQATEMLQNRIYMVVPQELKDGIPHYNKAPNIMSFEDFFTDHVEPAIARWKRSKVIF